MAGCLEIEVSYYHMPRRAGVGEGDFHRRSLQWKLPAEAVALVMVDVWSNHYITTHLERGREITVTRMLPVLEMFRRLGATVVHAPSADCRWKYGELSTPVSEVREEARSEGNAAGADWPPKEFRSKSGDYESFGRPVDPRDEVFDEIIKKRSIVPEVEPREGDCVIFDGEQLHRVLAERRVHTLFYAGFAANMCVPHRDYGMRAMKGRGYDIVLIRDCTTAIEMADTVEEMKLTQGAVLDTEVNVGYTVTSGELLTAGSQHKLPKVGETSLIM